MDTKRLITRAKSELAREHNTKRQSELLALLAILKDEYITTLERRLVIMLLKAKYEQGVLRVGKKPTLNSE